jgi:hypothetical protein
MTRLATPHHEKSTVLINKLDLREQTEPDAFEAERWYQLSRADASLAERAGLSTSYVC